MGEKWNAYGVSVGNPEKKGPPGRLKLEDAIKIGLKRNSLGSYGLDSPRSDSDQ
jgi:hypothetical protein